MTDRQKATEILTRMYQQEIQPDEILEHLIFNFLSGKQGKKKHQEHLHLLSRIRNPLPRINLVLQKPLPVLDCHTLREK